MNEGVDWKNKIIYVKPEFYLPVELRDKVLEIYDKAKPSLDDTLRPIEITYKTIITGWEMRDGWKLEKADD